MEWTTERRYRRYEDWTTRGKASHSRSYGHNLLGIHTIMLSQKLVS